MSYKKIKKYAKKGSKCRPGKKLGSFLGVTIHNTGNSSKGADALNHAKYLQGGGANSAASWHFAVDEDYAYQSIPINEIAWHAGDGGSGKGNTRTIGIEICMNSDGNLLEATDNAAHLTASILKSKGIKKALSNKNVFQHNHFSPYGKNCPQKIRAGKPYTWAKFVQKVNWYLDALWGKKVAAPTSNKKLISAQKWAAKRKTIRRGSKQKSEIKTLQKYLKKLGFKGKNGKALAVDGYWEGETAVAFAKFQKKYDLVEDDVCGLKSWTQLKYRAS